MSSMVPAKTSNGRLFLQLANNPAGSPGFYGCYALGSVSQSTGDISRILCPDPSSYEKFEVVGEISPAEESVTSSVTGRFSRDQRTQLVDLARSNHKVVVHAHYGLAQNPSSFSRFDKAVIFEGAIFGNPELGDMMSLSETAEIDVTVDFSADDWMEVLPMSYSETASDLSGESMGGAVAVYLNDASRPFDKQIAIFSVEKAVGAAPALIYSADRGGNWATKTITGSTASSVIDNVYMAGGDLVLESDADSLSYYISIEDAISGSGVFSTSPLGTVSSDVSMAGGVAFAIRGANIVKVLSGTDSETVGSIAAAASIGAGSNDVVWAHDGTDVRVSSDGGRVFRVCDASPANLGGPVYGVSETEAWACDTTGGLFYTINGGKDWVTATTFTSPVSHIAFPKKSIGYVVAGTSLYRTIAAGATGSWIKESLPTFSAANGLATIPRDANLVVVTGDATAVGIVILGSD